MDVYERIKRELLKKPKHKFSVLLFAACEEIQAEQIERERHEKAKYNFDRNPGFVVVGNR